MIQGFVVAIWTASLVTIGREHRFWHNSERVAQRLIYGCYRNLRVSELVIALRTGDGPSWHDTFHAVTGPPYENRTKERIQRSADLDSPICMHEKKLEPNGASTSLPP